jgi:ubiquinone/menaquinone biosynthesis C-methylase UbiE
MKPASPSPLLFFDTINAYQKTAALKAAIELDVFSALGGKAASAEELAARCGCPQRGIRILADHLVILGFLTKDGNHYSLTPDSAAFLDRKSPAYLGGSLEFFLAPSLMAGFDHLADTIRKGRTADEGTTAHEHEVWVRFARAMAPLMIMPARATAELITLDPARETRVLDIAASHGVYGIAVAEKNPRARLVALDWASVLEVAKENAAKAGLATRFETIAGDAFTTDLGANYDAVLVPNFLHHFKERDCVSFLKRAHAALRPGGSVVIVEFVPNEDRVTPPAAAGFSLVMLGSTPEGDAYTFAEYEKMLREAGFPSAEFHPLAPTAQSAVLARKP